MTTNKKCFKCDETKPIEDFYKHHRMKDGHLNKCKKCTRLDVYKNTEIKKLDPEWLEMERERCRIKQMKLKLTDLGLLQLQARSAVRGSVNNVLSSGFNLHHWSYNEQHHTDVIKLSYKDHRKIHRYLDLDIYSLMYRSRSGELLDTREKSEVEYARIIRDEED